MRYHLILDFNNFVNGNWSWNCLKLSCLVYKKKTTKTNPKNNNDQWLNWAKSITENIWFDYLRTKHMYEHS